VLCVLYRSSIQPFFYYHHHHHHHHYHYYHPHLIFSPSPLLIFIYFSLYLYPLPQPALYSYELERVMGAASSSASASVDRDFQGSIRQVRHALHTALLPFSLFIMYIFFRFSICNFFVIFLIFLPSFLSSFLPFFLPSFLPSFLPFFFRPLSSSSFSYLSCFLPAITYVSSSLLSSSCNHDFFVSNTSHLLAFISLPPDTSHLLFSPPLLTFSYQFHLSLTLISSTIAFSFTTSFTTSFISFFSTLVKAMVSASRLILLVFPLNHQHKVLKKYSPKQQQQGTLFLPPRKVPHGLL
jgi:hypothetical protein